MPEKEKKPGLPKFIVLEGPSGSGKTTFLNQFLRLYEHKSRHPLPDTGYITTHFGRAPGETVDDVYENYVRIVEFMRGAPLILDRWALSNLIYGHHLGNQTPLDSNRFADLSKAVVKWYGDSHAMLIFDCFVPKLRERNEVRGKDAFMKTFGPVIMSFRESARMGWLNPHLLDTTHRGPLATFERGMQLLETK